MVRCNNYVDGVGICGWIRVVEDMVNLFFVAGIEICQHSSDFPPILVGEYSKGVQFQFKGD